MIDTTKIPRHIAIIMDGNGRWAQEHGCSRFVGHREGVKTIHMVSELCSDLGVEVLTLYAFSTENWQRPKLEVKNLMELFKNFMPSKIDELNSNNVRMTVMGRLDELSGLVKRGILRTVEATKNNTGLNLNFAINYGGREEIIDGVKNYIAGRPGTQGHKATCKQVPKGQPLRVLDVDNFKSMLYYKDLPDVDLLIRTAGEWRVSNFMLFHIPYTEMFFTDVLWPEFTEAHLSEAIEDYQKRSRRFGNV